MICLATSDIFYDFVISTNEFSPHHDEQWTLKKSLTKYFRSVMCVLNLITFYSLNCVWTMDDDDSFTPDSFQAKMQTLPLCLWTIILAPKASFVLPWRVYLLDLLGWSWCWRSSFIFMLILSLTPHRGMFIILTVTSSSSPVWFRPAKAWNSMMWAFRPSRLIKFALLWEWWWCSISSIYPYFIRYIWNNKSNTYWSWKNHRKIQWTWGITKKISLSNWILNFNLDCANPCLTNDLLFYFWWHDGWYLWLNRNIRTCLWVISKNLTQCCALFCYFIFGFKHLLGFAVFFLCKVKWWRSLFSRKRTRSSRKMLHKTDYRIFS